MKYIYSIYSFIISFILHVYALFHVFTESSEDDFIENVFTFNIGVQILFGFFTLCSKSAYLQKMAVISRMYLIYIFEYNSDKLYMLNYMIYLILSWSLTDIVYFGYHISNSRFQKYNSKNSSIMNKMKYRLYNTFYATSFPIQTGVEIFMIVNSQCILHVRTCIFILHILYCITYYILKNAKRLKKSITETLIQIQDESYVSAKCISSPVTYVYWNDMKYEIKMNVSSIMELLNNCFSSSRQEWTELYRHHHRLRDKGYQLAKKRSICIFNVLTGLSIIQFPNYIAALNLLFLKSMFIMKIPNSEYISLNVFIYRMSISYLHTFICLGYAVPFQVSVINVILSSCGLLFGKNNRLEHEFSIALLSYVYYIYNECVIIIPIILSSLSLMFSFYKNHFIKEFIC